MISGILPNLGFMNLIIVLLFFILMEGVAWSAHKYLMHGFLWFLHRSHHRPMETEGFFERNDFFFVLFAIPGIILILLGSLDAWNWKFFAGLGIALYGLCYFIVHDVFIHQRLPWLRNTDNAYFRAIRKAHKVHHKKMDKENGESFGMLFVSMKYFRKMS